MVRRILVAVVLLAACHRGGGDADKASPASAQAQPVQAPATVRAPAPLTCRALDGCTSGCADAACAEACTRRLSPVARPVYEALQACVGPACADGDAGPAPCREPASLGCKMCVLSHCAAQATRCMGN